MWCGYYLLFSIFVTLTSYIILFSASLLHQLNVLSVIEGSHNKISACALSTITGIPLIRLHGDSNPPGQCENAVQLSAGYKAYAHASLDILNTFQWKKISLVYQGRGIYLVKSWIAATPIYIFQSPLYIANNNCVRRMHSSALLLLASPQIFQGAFSRPAEEMISMFYLGFKV